jgi:hypothetical protein
MDYKFTFEDGSEAIAHYGVKGMKWGKRKSKWRDADFTVTEQGGGTAEVPAWLIANNPVNTVTDAVKLSKSISSKISSKASDRPSNYKTLQYKTRSAKRILNAVKSKREIAKHAAKGRVKVLRALNIRATDGGKF